MRLLVGELLQNPFLSCQLYVILPFERFEFEVGQYGNDLHFYRVLKAVRCISSEKTIRFSLGGFVFEYDEEKNRKNIEKHGISFKTAARVFFDYDRIEMFDDTHSSEEDRYDTIGDASAGGFTIIGNLSSEASHFSDILFVVYTEREMASQDSKAVEVTRLISARLATNFERGLYYGKHS